jgi:putative tryptophan/tyrosine transport system substrate-binding protein
MLVLVSNRSCAISRRSFLAIMAGSATWAPLAIGQQSTLPTVGFLNSASPGTYDFNAAAFREGLREVGFVENESVRIEYRWARSDYDALPRLATELVSHGAVAIAATGDVASARAAKAAAGRKIPVVFTIGGDPVRFGLVESFNRPGANVTGISLLSNVLGAKRVEMLREITPKVSRIALLMNPNNPNAEAEAQDADVGARKFGCQTLVLNARNREEIDTALQRLLPEGINGLITGTDPIPLDRREQIVSFVNRHSIPAVYFVRQFAEAGGLLSYGPSITWMYRQAGIYIGKILKGASPADLPVLQPTRFELVINARTAKLAGLDVPSSMLALADEVIE